MPITEPWVGMAGIIPINNELSIYHHTCGAMDFTRTLLALGGIAVLPAHRLAAQNTPAQAARPNILFILSDDHTSQSWGI